MSFSYDEIALDKSTGHDLDIVVDRLQTSSDNKTRLTESLMAALELGEGICILHDIDSKDEELLSTKAYSSVWQLFVF